MVVEASPKVKRRRPRHDGPGMVKVVIEVGTMMDYPCSRRLREAWPGVVEAQPQHGEPVLSEALQAKLSVISPTAVDRLLQLDRVGHLWEPIAFSWPHGVRNGMRSAALSGGGLA